MRRSSIVFAIWCLLALAVLLPVTLLLKGSFPLFTVVWIIVPLVAVARTKDVSRVGFRAIAWGEFARIAALNLGGLLALMLLFEPWSHTYQMLVKIALANPQPDTTFAWLLRLPRPPAIGSMLLYSGLVTLFGEELFFRGWLLQLLLKRFRAGWAVIIQALLFTLPNLLAGFVLPPLQGALYVVVYTFLGIGLIGGWVAWRTQSIWPSLFSAAVMNLILVLLTFWG
jgi:membrane protease YdiL (CAAX protease family)